MKIIYIMAMLMFISISQIQAQPEPSEPVMKVRFMDSWQVNVTSLEEAASHYPLAEKIFEDAELENIYASLWKMSMTSIYDVVFSPGAACSIYDGDEIFLYFYCDKGMVEEVQVNLKGRWENCKQEIKTSVYHTFARVKVDEMSTKRFRFSFSIQLNNPPEEGGGFTRTFR